ncbi:Transducin (beta)-like 1 X-linked receptor 1, partial [Linnemannia elongata]
MALDVGAFHITVPTLGSRKINTNILSVTLPSRGFQTMAAVPSEVSSIVIAPAAPHRSLLELHYKPSPSEARTVPRSQRCESQVQKDECLVPILLETTPLDGQAEIDTGDPPSTSGITLDHIQQATAIDVTCSISEETPVTGEPSSPTVLPQTNGRHVQVKNTSRLVALRDTVHCTTTLTQCSHSLCECRPWTTPKTLPTELALRDRSSNELDVEDRLAQMRHQVLKDRSGRIYVPLQANTSPLVSNTKPLPLMPIVLNFIESKRPVFLLLGDSGSGKSTFCWQLVRTLWDNYTKGSRILILVDLRDINRLSDDLIESHLQEYGFSDTDVQELIHERQFVLVCDGYDESRFSTSIYTKRLGQLGVKMIVSCRIAFLGWDYQGRFYPLGDNRYHGECSELFDEAIITPFQKTDIQEFINQYVVELPTQEPSDNPSAPSFDDYWEKLSIIPNMMGLVSNPFLLTLALRALPSLSIDFQDLTNNNATRLQLYDGFVQEWIRINIARLQQSNLNQDYRTVFDSLLNDGFAWCVKDFSKRLAEAMHEHQKGRLVVKFRYRRFRHWFIHKSLFDYFRSLVLYDPDESDDDESEDDESDDEASDDDDSDDDWGEPHDGGGNPFSNEGDGRYDDGGDFNGGDGSLSGGNFIPTSNNGGSASGGGGGPSSAISDSPGGIGGSSGSNGGSAESNGGSPGDNSAPMGGSDGSGGKDGSSGNGDSSHQGKDSYRSRRKASKKKSRPSSDPLSTQNLLGDPAVLEFLVERAQSDSRFKKRLFLTIEQSKALSVPSLAAANAITILIKSGETLGDAVLEGVVVPTGYLRPGTVQGHTAGRGTTGRMLKITLEALHDSPRRTAPSAQKWYRSSLRMPQSRMGVLPPSDLPTLASSSKFLNVTCTMHHKANSSSTIKVSLSELDHDNGSEKGYKSDSGIFSKLLRKDPIFGKSRSKEIPHTLSSGPLADVPVPVITVDTPESTRATVARESETVQLLRPDDGTIPQRPISDPTDLRSTDQPSFLMTSALQYDIFLVDAPKPTVRAPTLDVPRAPMESTLQLVHCARLLLEDQHPSTSRSSPTEVDVLDDTGRHWLDAIQEDPLALTRIRWLVSRLDKEFRNDLSLGPEAIFEVVILGPVLCKVDYRDLLSCFIERFDQSALLNASLLQGMTQLLQSAPSGFLTDDDLIHIVSSLRKRLESTHASDRAHVYQLVFAVSKVLEVMVRGEVKDLNRQRHHQSLLAALRNLKGVDNDEFLKFQVSYAYQMSLYLPDDETSFQAFWRYAESVAVGVSAAASDFKLDPMSALAAVEHIQQVAGNAIDVAEFNIDSAQVFQVTAERAAQAAEKAYCSQKKQPWFLALQAGYLFAQDGRLVDFNVLVCDATRRYDVNFQCGVCQILGEMALNPLWDDGSRRSAIEFLGELCKTDAGRRKDGKVKKWVATALQQISRSASPDISEYAGTLLDRLQQEHALDIKGCHALHTLLPIPKVFPLLERALYITDIDHELACIRFQGLDKHLHPVSIPLRAKATLQAPKDQSFPLMAKVQEFLQSNRLVFLLLGDSGSGKSTFCRQLERELWNQHQCGDGDRIPLYINLPSIDDPHCDLIGKYLRLYHNISKTTIQNIKDHRQFVLICDGYDESRLIQNLYTTNRFNRPGQWDVKMIITCRSTFLGPDYQCRFYPLGDDKYYDKSSGLFEESTIVPFQKSDIQEFVKQYVLNVAAQDLSDNPSAPSFDDYWEKLSVIPNVMNLASNPFLLTLALKAIPSQSIKAVDSRGLKAMQKDLYDGFMQEWTRLQKIRLQGTILKQDIRAAAFDGLLRDGFSWCVIDYLKRLADAIYQYQDGRPVVKFSRRHMEEWKVEFFGPEIETTLLRKASPLARAGIRHWFIHKSLLDYFYALTFHDPDDSDDDDSGDSEDGGDDPRGGGDHFHNGGGNSLGNGGNGRVDDNGDLAGGNERSTGGSAQSTVNNSGSSGGNGVSTSRNQDSSGGGSNSSGGSNGSGYGGNNDGSRGDKNGSNGDEDDSRRRKDDARSKRKRNATKARPSISSEPFSKRNLFKEPSVLQFLVERAESDSRLKKRLFSAIEQSKASSVPNLAAANAITILFKSKNIFEDAVLDGVPIPSDYMSTAMGNMEPVQLPESNLTGGDLMKVLVTLTSPESESTLPATSLTVLVSAPTISASIPFSTTIAQTISTVSLKPPRTADKNRPPLVPPKPKLSPYPTLDLKANFVLSQASILPLPDNQSTTSRTVQGKALSVPVNEACVFETILAEDLPKPVRSALQDLTVDESALIKDPYPLKAHAPLPSASPLLTKDQNTIEEKHFHRKLEHTASPGRMSSKSGDVPTLTQGLANPSKIVKVMANEGKSGEPFEFAYTNCK